MKRWLLFAMMLLLTGAQLLAAQDAPPAKIDLALTDLSAEVGETVTLDDLDSYQWSTESFNDASMGCPEVGQNYAQVVTPGYQFLLTYKGQTYDFRYPRQGDVGRFCGVVAVVESTETPVPAATALTVEDVTFTADPALGLGEAAGTVVPFVAESDDVPFWSPAPEHVRFEFASDAAVFPPQIVIYPVADFEAMNIDAVNAEIDALRTLLEIRPALDDRPPYLPLINAGRVLWTQSKYLDFPGGSGVRYLTAFHQAAMPIVNADLLYTFQGMTSDGQYYVSATFPVRTDSLPDEVGTEEPNFDVTASIADSAAMLNDLAPEAFTPNLSLLDNLMMSLTIGNRGPQITTVLWEDAQNMILNGEVTTIFQAQSLDVTLTLTDGTQVKTTEPTIDAVFAVIEQCGDTCANISLATE